MAPAHNPDEDQLQVGGVRELFESHESEQLPIPVQLQRYIKRDLRSSHHHRTACSVLGEHKRAKRSHSLAAGLYEHAADLSLAQNFNRCALKSSKVFPYYYASKPRREAPTQLPVVRAGVATDDDDDADNYWLRDRQRLRADLDRVGLCQPWLLKKPDKSESERRILRILNRPEIGYPSTDTETQVGESKSQVEDTNEWSRQDLYTARTSQSIESRVNAIRQRRLKDYDHITDLCEESGIVLNEQLMRKLLLHPGDDATASKSLATLRKDGASSVNLQSPSAFKISQQQAAAASLQRSVACAMRSDDGKQAAMKIRPPTDLLSENFWKTFKTRRRRLQKSAESSDAASSDEEESLAGKDTRKSKTTFYPRSRDVAADRHSINLSTGRAMVSRKVDCWLTLEEYQKLCKDLDPRLRILRSDPDAFWPGQLSDKLRRVESPCLPACEAACAGARSRNTIFRDARQRPHNAPLRCNPGFDNNERTWPIKHGRFVKYGDVTWRN